MVDASLTPRSFARQPPPGQLDPYLDDPPTRKLAEFFRAKGTAALKDEDAREAWYQDWVDYQAGHRLYASVLAPREFSTLGCQLDLLRLTRFVEVFAYFSPSHGYSLQVSFLGLFSILLGTNDALKREAVAALEAGGLLALGVSERDHGSDLLSNEFAVTEVDGDHDDAGPARLVADGRKYYIGNANRAAIVSILARRHVPRDTPARKRRAPFALIAVRPPTAPGYRAVRKIRTLGVRAAFVGAFEVVAHPVAAGDVIADGRGAWDAVFGTVTLGKFLLGFASIGICEHATEEATAYLRGRVLYRRAVLGMPHIRLATAQAYARLAAMKLYAYRALDYVQASSPTDQRYLLFCAVQKARVSTEGVKVIAQLSECVGARGFEADTYFESALRDVQLIPGLEGSTHINVAFTARLTHGYFARRAAPPAHQPPFPQSLARGDTPAVENPYLTRAHPLGRTGDVAFAHFLDAYRPLAGVANVRRFARQATAFARLIRTRARDATPTAPSPTAPSPTAPSPTDPPTDGGAAPPDALVVLCLGQCTAVIAYGQLVAENAVLFSIAPPMVSAIFHLLVIDLAAAATALAALPGWDAATRAAARRLIAPPPRTPAADWDHVASRADDADRVASA
jgi:acyl-CoA dehydrogenase